MTRQRGSRWAQVGGLLVCALWAGCGSETAQAPQQRQVSVPEAPTDNALPDAGCTITQRVADATGCRGEWVCAETVARSLLCAAIDGGIVCSCDENGEDESAAGAAGATPAPLRSAGTCASPEEVSAIAASLCGWDVP